MTPDTDTSLDDAQAPDPRPSTQPTPGESHAESADGREHVRFSTGPSPRPTAVKLGVAVVVGLLIEAILFANPELLGSPEATRIGIYIVSLVALLVVARLLLRVYLLTRYRYVVTDDAIRWEYTLLYRSRARELPLSELRGHETTRSRVQSLLGFGTVRFLTGGTNRSLGFLAFENVAKPERIRELVRRRTKRE